MTGYSLKIEVIMEIMWGILSHHCLRANYLFKDTPLQHNICTTTCYQLTCLAVDQQQCCWRQNWKGLVFKNKETDDGLTTLGV